MTINKERVDNKILSLLENGVKNKHRSIIGVCGKVKDVVHHVHSLLSRYTIRPRVLWVYEKELEAKTHKIGKAKKRRGAGECVLSNFESFIVNTDINYVFHSEAEKVLGTTTDLCILQDFSKIRANSLASVVESVKGGGVILLPVDETDSIYTRRLYHLLQSADNYLILDSQMNVLKYESQKETELETEKENRVEEKVQKIKEAANPLNPLSIISANSTAVLMRQCKTEDQADAVFQLSQILERRSLVAITADRGRGKSAALGLSIAHAVVKGMNDILISAPHLSNVQTVFEFAVTGLAANGYKEQFDFFIEYSKTFKKLIEKITVSKTHYQTIRFAAPQKLGHSPSMLVVDEAAAIPLPILKEMLGMYPTMISSTTAGYEGTGRALSLKLFKSLNPEIIRLEEPIRYSRNDPVEKWLNGALSLAPEIPKMITFPKHEKCRTYSVNKSLLFSGHEETEKILKSLSSILLSGHYKNSPNDLQTLADDENHALVVLLTEDGRVLGLAQCVKEGSRMEMDETQKAYNEKRTEKGNLIPWSISQYFLDMEIFEQLGMRIIRIAIHPDAQSMGYGSYLVNEIVKAADGKNENLSKSQIGGSDSSNVLFSALSLCKVDYIGVSFGVTQKLLDFWLRLEMKPVYLKHTLCKTTGEHSLITMRPLSDRAAEKIEKYRKEFTERFLELLPGCFSAVPTVIALQVVTPNQAGVKVFTEEQVRRMQQFARCNLDLRIVIDLIPMIAKEVLKTKKQIISSTQKIILLAVGLQHKTLESVSSELKLQPSQVKMLIAKALSSLSSNNGQ
ncbi:N-acetyltransferase 10 [Nematocida minor]|uniref:N-acetyltransferase 10 n=1 Tax=Nematocida minor TaxID=1912983 RepID=UPI002220C767|nr:N-acetyltransferase 10 [Nematocida minor]KAI5192374.1 N-acetyltransferase 10 [Nematocida minor]